MTTELARLTRTFIWLGLSALLLSSILIPATAHAQDAPAATLSGLQIESRDGALQLQWQGSVQAATTGNTPAATSYGGYLLPLQTVVVELSSDLGTDGTSTAVTVQGLSSSPYTGELTLAPQHLPPALDYVPSPTNTPYAEPQLPSSPIFVMAEGSKRGQRMAVLGFSPIYQDANTGEVLAVENFEASVAGASVVAASDAPNNEATADPTMESLFTPVATLATAPAPTNPLANTNAFKVIVSEAGIQQISGAELAAAGLASPQASKLRVFYQGIEVPLHIIDGNNNNVLDAGDYLRFYADSIGNAWNQNSIYWLSTGTTNGLRMTQRAVAPAGANARNTAYEVGQYQDSSVYESTLAGADGDNWFQANLRAESENAKYEVQLPHQLPLNNALPTILNVKLTPYTIGPYGLVNHRIQYSTSGLNLVDNWDTSFTGANPFQNISRNISLGKAADSWSFTLLKETSGRAVMVDAIDYLLPVQLNFGSKGAIFQGIEGTWRYQLTNTPTSVTGGRALYDITNPAQPQRLTIAGSANFDFQDGPTANRYLMTGPGAFFTPSIEAHSAVNLGGAGAAHTVYIAPLEFHAALQKLVDLRKSQGYKVRVVDVQDIYDSWGYGMVDADAIRDFLRYVVGKWSPAPIAAVLVGDTTWDPKNFLGVGNPNIIPPYMANVDPWLKYVPCDSCFGQLDGDSPTSEVGFLADIWIGRFPVINAIELSTVVNKIVGYETDPNTHALWRSTSLQIADDDVRPDNTIDTAGSFVGSAEHVISLMPTSIRQLRNYFFAATDLSNVPTELVNIINSVLPWFSNDPDQAMLRSINLMNSGVGMVTYTGHGNHWQWARTVVDGNKWLFGLWEVRQLVNPYTPFISMSMTCYTSQFHIPAPDHFTLDEHLFLYGNGGAVSTWGPTGFSIVPAHDTLQVGFHKLLWKSPSHKAKLGALTAAGYEEVFISGRNFDVNKTFAVFGDPLTSARVAPVESIYMPKLNR